MNNMFRLFVTLLLFFPLLFIGTSVYSEQQTVLTGSVSMVPQSFYGTWRVMSDLKDTDSPNIFKKSGLDLWNLSRTFDVINLSNPFNGAKAEIKVDRVEDNFVVFKKSGKYGSKLLTDVVEIQLKGDSFIGVDKIRLDTFVGGKIMKTETAIYNLKGEKIAGDVK